MAYASDWGQMDCGRPVGETRIYTPAIGTVLDIVIVLKFNKSLMINACFVVGGGGDVNYTARR